MSDQVGWHFDRSRRLDEEGSFRMPQQTSGYAYKKDFILLYQCLNDLRTAKDALRRQQLMQSARMALVRVQHRAVDTTNLGLLGPQSEDPETIEETETIELVDSSDEDDLIQTERSKVGSANAEDIRNRENSSMKGVGGTPFLKNVNSRHLNQPTYLSKLLKLSTDGKTLFCSICNEKVDDSQSCRTCLEFHSKMILRNRDGIPLPSCEHDNFSQLKNCGSCRFWMFVTIKEEETVRTPQQSTLNSQEALAGTSDALDSPMSPDMPDRGISIDTSVRISSGKLEVCPVCLQTSSVMIGWKCKSCSQFEGQLLEWHAEGKLLPVCTHKGEKLQLGCLGCRYHRLRTQWEIYHPELNLRLQFDADDSAVRKSDGKKRCIVCSKTMHFLNHWCCMQCFLFKERLVKMYRNDEQLPECNHMGQQGAACEGCLRYLLQSQWVSYAPKEPLYLPSYPALQRNEYTHKTCPICKNTMQAMVDWRCKSCYEFELRLLQQYSKGQKIPMCKHEGTRLHEKCEGCHRYHLQLQWAIYAPDKSLVLPNIKSIIKNQRSPSRSSVKRKKVESRASSKHAKLKRVSDSGDSDVTFSAASVVAEKSSMRNIPACSIPKTLELEAKSSKPPFTRVSGRTSSILPVHSESSNIDAVASAPEHSGRESDKLCLICSIGSRHSKGRCSPCVQAYKRLQQMVEKGDQLPVCDHSGSKLGKCLGCRRYLLQENWELLGVDIPYEIPKIPKRSSKINTSLKQNTSSSNNQCSTCTVCGAAKPLQLMRKWRCNPCYRSELRYAMDRKRHKALPKCNHGRQYENSCRGCHLSKLREQWEIHQPDQPFPIPFSGKGYKSRTQEASTSAKRGSIKTQRKSSAVKGGELKQQQKENPVEDVCPVCNRPANRMILWRCSVCYRFEYHLKELFQKGKELPACDHNKTQPIEGCHGCRRFHIEKHKRIHQKGDLPWEDTSPTASVSASGKTARFKTQQASSVSGGDKNQKQEENLIRGNMCPVCNRPTTRMRVWRCDSCYRYECRLKKLLQEGKDLPACDHNKAQLIEGCCGCRRFHIEKYKKMHEKLSKPASTGRVSASGKSTTVKIQRAYVGDRNDTIKKKNEGNPVTDICPVCRRPTNCMNLWRCSTCSRFEYHLKELFRKGKELPACDHKKAQLFKGCSGCRRFHIEKHRRIHEKGDLPWEKPSSSSAGTSNTEEVVAVECLVCEKLCADLVEWRCNDCYQFENKLKRMAKNGKPLPTCNHMGMKRHLGCKGCLRMQIHVMKEIFSQEFPGTQNMKAGNKVTCPVCLKDKNSVKLWRCVPCVQFERALKKKYESKIPLPNCSHEGTKVAEGCPGCRRFRLMKLRPIFTPKSSFLPPMEELKTCEGCPVCLMPRRLKDWKCYACFTFTKNLMDKYSKGLRMPSCTHKGAGALQCLGCRRYRLEILWNEKSPNEPYLLPPMNTDDDSPEEPPEITDEEVRTREVGETDHESPEGLSEIPDEEVRSREEVDEIDHESPEEPPEIPNEESRPREEDDDIKRESPSSPSSRDDSCSLEQVDVKEEPNDVECPNGIASMTCSPMSPTFTTNEAALPRSIFNETQFSQFRLANETFKLTDDIYQFPDVKLEDLSDARSGEELKVFKTDDSDSSNTGFSSDTTPSDNEEDDSASLFIYEQ